MGESRAAFQVIFSGTVQGVGFRYTTERLARHFEVTGYVRNLPDGNVELAAEGGRAVLEDFLAAVLDGPMKPYIRDKTVKWLEPQGKYTQFGIAF